MHSIQPGLPRTTNDNGSATTARDKNMSVAAARYSQLAAAGPIRYRPRHITPGEKNRNGRNHFREPSGAAGSVTTQLAASSEPNSLRNIVARVEIDRNVEVDEETRSSTKIWCCCSFIRNFFR